MSNRVICAVHFRWSKFSKSGHYWSTLKWQRPRCVIGHTQASKLVLYYVDWVVPAPPGSCCLRRHGNDTRKGDKKGRQYSQLYTRPTSTKLSASLVHPAPLTCSTLCCPHSLLANYRIEILPSMDFERFGQNNTLPLTLEKKQMCFISFIFANILTINYFWEFCLPWPSANY